MDGKYFVCEEDPDDERDDANQTGNHDAVDKREISPMPVNETIFLAPISIRPCHGQLRLQTAVKPALGESVRNKLSNIHYQWTRVLRLRPFNIGGICYMGTFCSVSLFLT